MSKVTGAIEVPERYHPFLDTAVKGPGPYQYAHKWLCNNHGPASDYLCEGGCQGRAAEWAWVHGTTTYVPLCRQCHMQYDGLSGAAGKCINGHNVTRWGRHRGGACKVCSRIHTASRSGWTRCQNCGYGPCRCLS
jgi:hypothetical protein